MSKYGNVKTNGYDSKKEAARAEYLKTLQQAGMIQCLCEQVTFLLIPKMGDERPVSYRADFAYRDIEGNYIVEDVKGMKTREYIIKRKLMLFIHGIKVVEV